ncbi:hypothetical protein CBS101457_000354 [Exobasidium rhododendri]|nr:hypothetical protein CBS101457_000354 [Exobasidium rhododendri]
MTSYQYWQLPEIGSRNGEGSLSLKTANSIPEPGKGEVLVKVYAVSLNFRDLIITKNQYPLEIQKEPLVPASDGAGEVVKVGDGVTKFKKSDRVAANFTLQHLNGNTPTKDETNTALGGAVDGMMTQYKILPQESLVLLPSHLSYEEGASLVCAGLTAFNGLFGLKDVLVLPGSTVVALGTGGVSVFGAQFAIAAGARVVITSSSDEKLKKVRALFTKEQLLRLTTVNYKTTPDWEKEVLKVSPDGATHILEVGGAGTIEKSHACIKRGGVIVNIGFVAQGEMPNLALLNLMAGSILRGVLVGSVEQFRQMNECIETHQIVPLVDKVFEFKDAPSAYAYQWSQQHVGKVVIKLQ